MQFEAKKHHNDLLFLPLGGANEIGMNLNLYHLNGKWLMVDCGVGFAYNVPGIDMMTADISFIKANKKNLLGIILTHIHEDHLGAVQYLWQELEVDVYATTLAANFLRSKLSEFKLDKKVPIHIIDNSKDLKLGSFSIEFLGLTHSVPEMKALIIKTEKGNILHTGDWKFDPNPVIGEVSEKEKIRAYGDQGKFLAVICDSTNAINEGHSRSEGDLHSSIKYLVKDRKGLVGVTTFASNIARIQTIATIAKEVGRKVVLAGYSLHRIMEVAKKSGYDFSEADFISDREMKFFNKNEILILCTGCQGEELAAAKKIATDTHPFIKFGKNDLMIFSSKIIPGNEKKIFALFDDMAKKQIDVMTEKDHFVHVSGHPSQDELKEMYALARPKVAIPVHGEFLHTKVHAEIAAECGVARVIQVENGEIIKLQEDNFLSETKRIGFVKSGYLGVDGKQLINLESNIIKERRKLQNSGIIIITLLLNSNLSLQSKIKLQSVGCYDLASDQQASDMIKKEIEILIRNKARELKIDNANEGFSLNFLKKKKKKNNKNLSETKIASEIEKLIRSRVLKIFEDLTSKRPALETTVMITNY
jgi:ribonuclease J